MSTPQFSGRACKTCRRRGRRCDRRLPACGTCESSALACEGYLLRWSGLASRGRLAGKTVPVSLGSGEKRQKRPRHAQRAPSTQTPSPVHSIDSSTAEPTAEPRRDGYDSQASNEVAGNDDSTAPPVEPLLWDINAASQIDPLLCTTPPGLSDNAFLDNGRVETPPDFNLLCDAPVESELSLYSKPSLLFGLDPFRIPAELNFILEYHLCEVVPKLCVDNYAPANPYRDYIFPLATEVPSLLYACAALAACHFNTRLGTTQFLPEFLRFKGKAMKRLQEDLYSESRAKHPATIATILMLCLCDICQGGFSNFESHFWGAKRLIELRDSERTLGCFVEQYLVWWVVETPRCDFASRVFKGADLEYFCAFRLDIMAAASHSRQPVFSSQDTEGFLNGSGRSWSFDVFPCTSEQFQLVCEAVRLYKGDCIADPPSPEILHQVDEIKQRLLQSPSQSGRGKHWFHLTEAYRYAILLYIIRLFQCEIDEYEIDWLVSSVFYHARSTPPASGWSDQLLWPLFHAGLEIRDSKRHEWLRERAQCMQTSGGFGNVQSALNILEGVWAGERPTRYLDLMLGFGNVNLLLI